MVIAIAKKELPNALRQDRLAAMRRSGRYYAEDLVPAQKDTEPGHEKTKKPGVVSVVSEFFAYIGAASFGQQAVTSEGELLTAPMQMSTQTGGSAGTSGSSSTSSNSQIIKLTTKTQLAINNILGNQPLSRRAKIALWATGIWSGIHLTTGYLLVGIISDFGPNAATFMAKIAGLEYLGSLALFPLAVLIYRGTRLISKGQSQKSLQKLLVGSQPNQISLAKTLLEIKPKKRFILWRALFKTRSVAKQERKLLGSLDDALLSNINELKEAIKQARDIEASTAPRFKRALTLAKNTAARRTLVLDFIADKDLNPALRLLLDLCLNLPSSKARRVSTSAIESIARNLVNPTITSEEKKEILDRLHDEDKAFVEAVIEANKACLAWERLAALDKTAQCDTQLSAARAILLIIPADGAVHTHLQSTIAAIELVQATRDFETLKKEWEAIANDDEKSQQAPGFLARAEQIRDKLSSNNETGAKELKEKNESMINDILSYIVTPEIRTIIININQGYRIDEDAVICYLSALKAQHELQEYHTKEIAGQPNKDDHAVTKALTAMEKLLSQFKHNLQSHLFVGQTAEAQEVTYVRLREIATGQDTVYAGIDLSLVHTLADVKQPEESKLVAIKEFSRLEPGEAARFEGEISALMTLRGEDNIISLLAFGQTTRPGIVRPFYVMEYMGEDKPTLAKVLEQPDKYKTDFNLSNDEVRLSVFQQICKGANAAQANGIAHRDLKPANIFLTRQPVPGRSDLRPRLVVKVADFGIARVLADTNRTAAEKTSTAMLIGTQSYMAPEAADTAKKAADGPITAANLATKLQITEVQAITLVEHLRRLELVDKKYRYVGTPDPNKFASEVTVASINSTTIHQALMELSLPFRLEVFEAYKRADIYALACIVYELFNGKPPYGYIEDSENLYVYLAKRQTLPEQGQIPDKYWPIIRQSLDPDPSKRHSSPEHFSVALTHAKFPQATPPAPPQPPIPPAQKPGQEASPTPPTPPIDTIPVDCSYIPNEVSQVDVVLVKLILELSDSTGLLTIVRDKQISLFLSRAALRDEIKNNLPCQDKIGTILELLANQRAQRGKKHHG